MVPTDTNRRSTSDRRQSHRILIDLEVDYQCEDTFLFAYITDLSAYGIFIRTNNPEAAGTHLNLRFTLPNETEPLVLEGEVIWINPFRPGDFDNINPGMGVKLLDMGDSQKERLLNLIRCIAYLEEHDKDRSSEDATQGEGEEEDQDQADRGDIAGATNNGGGE